MNKKMCKVNVLLRFTLLNEDFWLVQILYKIWDLYPLECPFARLFSVCRAETPLSPRILSCLNHEEAHPDDPPCDAQAERHPWKGHSDSDRAQWMPICV